MVYFSLRENKALHWRMRNNRCTGKTPDSSRQGKKRTSLLHVWTIVRRTFKMRRTLLSSDQYNNSICLVKCKDRRSFYIVKAAPCALPIISDFFDRCERQPPHFTVRQTDARPVSGSGLKACFGAFVQDKNFSGVWRGRTAHDDARGHHDGEVRGLMVIILVKMQ